MTNFEGR